MMGPLGEKPSVVSRVRRSNFIVLIGEDCPASERRAKPVTLDRLPDRFGFSRCIGFVAAHRRAWRACWRRSLGRRFGIGSDAICNCRPQRFLLTTITTERNSATTVAAVKGRPERPPLCPLRPLDAEHLNGLLRPRQIFVFFNLPTGPRRQLHWHGAKDSRRPGAGRSCSQAPGVRSPTQLVRNFPVHEHSATISMTAVTSM
jgi:hypothetical protein